MFQEILHSTCGRVAFLYLGKAVPDERIMRDRVRGLLGRVPPAAVRMRCGTCNQALAASSLRPGLLVYDMASTEDMQRLYEGTNSQEE